MDELIKWVNKILGRELTEQEKSEVPKIPAPASTPTDLKITASASNSDIEKLQATIQEQVKVNIALLEKLNAQEAAQKKADETTLAKAESDRKAAIDTKIAEAKAKGIIPPDNKLIEDSWRDVLNTNYNNGTKLLDTQAPINAGTPPAGNTQPNTGATNVVTKTPTPLEAAFAGAEQAFKDDAAK